jgi:EpsI family protein
VFIAIVLSLAAGYLARVSRAESVPPRQPLATFPMEVANWTGQRARDFDARVVAVLGVDDYITRVYAGTAGPVSLYVGYHASQRQGDSIHSPMNCLPGAGWQPIEAGRRLVAIPDTAREGAVEVNRFVIQKGEDTQVVLYWYQSHGRVIASEYWGKFYLVADAIRFNRTDAALVRIVSPVARQDGSPRRAEDRAVAFATAIFPLLEAHLPH